MRLSILVSAAAVAASLGAAALGGCASGGYDYSYGPPAGPYADVDYDGFYDDYYGPFNGGFWGPTTASGMPTKAAASTGDAARPLRPHREGPISTPSTVTLRGGTAAIAPDPLRRDGSPWARHRSRTSLQKTALDLVLRRLGLIRPDVRPHCRRSAACLA